VTFPFQCPQSEAAQEVVNVLTKLQEEFRAGLVRVDPSSQDFEPVSWLRNDGVNGGGMRFQRTTDDFLNCASLNFSSVHYESEPERALASATALSCIVHPKAPLAPSLHMHISWTQLKSGRAGWRMMADLNPSNPIEAHTTAFSERLNAVFQDRSDVLEHGLAQGEQYFSIPALERHRGVVHFYLEQWSTDDFAADKKLAYQLGHEVIQCYLGLVEDGLAKGEATEAQTQAQLAYHTLYMFQVLTLDRGTTSGILVHDQNDQGILGSLPSVVDRDLLASWVEKLPSLQQLLLNRILEALPKTPHVELTPALRIKLAQVLRRHYQEHPETQSLLAKGFDVPPTVKNHQVVIGSL
jgi:coproporphyrinogen III oxidase